MLQLLQYTSTTGNICFLSAFSALSLSLLSLLSFLLALRDADVPAHSDEVTQQYLADLDNMHKVTTGLHWTLYYT